MSKIPFYVLLGAAFWLGSCGGGSSDDDTTPGDDDDDDDEPDTADTAGGNGPPEVDLVPAALGVEINTALSADGQPTYWIYAGDQQIWSTYLVITITDVEYFSLGADDPERQNHMCEFYASFPHIVDDTPPQGENFDYEAGSGGTGTKTPLWFFADGRADIFSNSIATDGDGGYYYDEYGEYMDSPACASLKEQGYPDIIDGMHVGVGFGPLSTYLYEEYWGSFEDAELADYEPATTGMYIAINHPNGAEPEGFDFVPYDWGSAIFFEAAVAPMELYDYYGNPVTEDVATASVNPDGTLVLGTPMTDSLVRGFAYWYEDFPNFDLSLLKEGVPALPE